ncbi:MAG: glycine--tRNA ligase subunit beta, partial [Synechococcaceae cyanobacterium]|nr:glycine--tRNA ligase subunit beta [Synechococcaceae cyanobacterium]
MSTFLLEIGTEELPADFARLALPQLEQLVLRDLTEARLGHGAIRCTSTPRRLAVIVDALKAAAPDLEEDRKGPPAGQAFKDGAPTQAAIGFAKRCGIAADQLEVRDTPKGPFVFARVLERGRPAPELLGEWIPQWINSLQGRRFMRWGSGESRFSRPVRWLVAMLDGQVVPVRLEGSDPEVSSGNSSRGHRLKSDAVSIASASAYAEALAAAGVQVERSARGQWIREQVAAAAQALEATPDLPDDLFEELTDLVESPLLIEGSVADHYLAL